MSSCLFLPDRNTSVSPRVPHGEMDAAYLSPFSPQRDQRATTQNRGLPKAVRGKQQDETFSRLAQESTVLSSFQPQPLACCLKFHISVSQLVVHSVTA